MTDAVRTVVSQLREVTPKINRATDDATAAVRSVESFLSGLDVGISAGVMYNNGVNTVEFDGVHESVVNIAMSLIYQRHDGKYRITIVESRSNDGGETWIDERVIPWLEARRDEKLASFPSLPVLLDGINEEAESLVEQADSAGAAVAEILSALGQGVARPDIDLDTLRCILANDVHNGSFAFIDPTTREIECLDPICDDDREEELRKAGWIEIKKWSDPSSLRCFVESDWTDDQSLEDEAMEVYVRNNGHHRSWKDNAPGEAVAAFCEYEEARRDEHCEAFLKEHGLA